MSAIDVMTSEHQDLRLRLLTEARPLAATVDGTVPFEPMRDSLVRFLLDELTPHLAMDEELLTTASDRADTRLLAEAIRAQRRAIVAAITDLREASTAWEAVAATRALHSLLAVHHMQEEELLLPTLSERPAPCR
jgi:hypothetical protein